MKHLTFLTIAALLAASASYSQTPTTSDAQGFEIIDGNADVSGLPDTSRGNAQEKWSKACSEWKSDTERLNKENHNQVLSLSCGASNCNLQESTGTYVCASSATYKIKTAGTLIPPAPTPPAMPAEQVIQTAPPPVIVEAAPPPRPGFVWVVGYWGWVGRRHLWYPGHWIVERPGFIWVGHSWMRRGNGWAFRPGHWDHHRR